jgi:hypothetical protein
MFSGGQVNLNKYDVEPTTNYRPGPQALEVEAEVIYPSNPYRGKHSLQLIVQ